MRIQELPGGVDLTYCTNIHAGESWEEIEAVLEENVPAVRRSLGFEGQFGIGLRLSGLAAGALSQPEVLARFIAQLERLNAYVFTINAFPYGPFHGTSVKERVYLPDWRSEERVRFTAEVAGILARLLPPGASGSISTVPGGFEADLTSADAIAAVAAGLVAAVATLVRIARDHQRVIVLALEPEPACLLETVEETISFFTQYLFSPMSVAQLASETGLDLAEATAALRRHLGVCYDVCHGSVVFEDPLRAISRLNAAGIAVAKIQLSAAIRVPLMTPVIAGLLSAFDDGVYLHQTTVRDGDALHRFLDLSAAIAAFEGGSLQGETRVHCHVPLFLSQFGALGTTQRDLLAVLEAVRQRPLSPHLEVETYTWDVLPSALRGATKADAIAQELRFVRQLLTPHVDERAA